MCDFSVFFLSTITLIIIRKLVLPLSMLDPSLTDKGFAFATVNGISYLHFC